MGVFGSKVRYFGGVLAVAGTLSACGGNHNTDNNAQTGTLAPPETSAPQTSPEQQIASSTPSADLANVEGITNVTDQIEPAAQHPPTTNTLPVGKWLLQNVTSERDSFSLKDSQQTYTLELSNDGKATGSVACNRWHGSASYGNADNGLGTLQLNVTGTSRKRCMFKNENEQQLEYRYLKQLKEPASYVIANNSLTLTLHNKEVWLYTKSSN